MAERRRAAQAALADPAARARALETLAELALVEDGDAAKALATLSERPAPVSGVGAVVEAHAAEAAGDLTREVGGWLSALRIGGDMERRLALLRLLRMADWLPERARAELRTGLVAVPGDMRLDADALLADIDPDRTVGARPLRLRVGLRATATPISDWVDGRPPPVATAPAGTVDGELRLANVGPALVSIELSVPGSPIGTWVRIRTAGAVRATVDGQAVVTRDPSVAPGAAVRQFWLAPGVRPQTVRLTATAVEPRTRLGIALVHARSAAPLRSASPGWLVSLHDAELGRRRQDPDASQAAAAALKRAAPRFVAGPLAAAHADGADPDLVRKDLGRLSASGHAAVIRALASAALDAGRTQVAIGFLRRLQASRDPRSLLVAFRILRDRGWAESAGEALARVAAVSPGACAVAMERLQHRWEALRLARAEPEGGLVPHRCIRRPGVPERLAAFYAESGRPARAAELLAGEALRRRDPTVAASLRARTLERLGRLDEATRVVRALVAASPGELQPRFALGDLLAARGDRAGARRAWRVASASASGDGDERLRLMAVGHGDVWRRFRPDVEPVLAEAIPPAFIQGHSAVLLLDHQTSLVFRGGARINHVHQALRVLSREAAEELGESEVPAHAHVLRAATRKADGRILVPEDIAEKETISFPELDTGDVIEIEYLTWSRPDPELGGGWILRPFYLRIFDVPTWRASYVVLHQEGMEAHWEAMGRVAPPEALRAPGFVGWRWTSHAAPAVQPEPAEVDPFDALPRVYVWSGLGWPRLFALYRESLLRLLGTDAAIRARVRALTAVDAPRRATARAIYGWVRKHVVEDDGSFLDISARRSVARGRGERVVVLLAMLRAAGLAADLLLVDPIHRTHAARRVPDLRDHSYAVVRLRLGGGPPIYLDPSFDGAAFGFLPPTIRGRSGVVIGPGPSGEHVVTPTESGVPEQRRVRIAVNAARDGSLAVVWEEEVTGMDAIVLRSALHGKPDRDRRRLFSGVAREVLASARLKSLVVGGLGTPERPVHLRATFTAPPGTASNLEVGLLPGWLARRWIHTPTRHMPLYADRFEALDLEVRIDGMPAGVALPRAVRFEGRPGTYERTARRDGDTIVLTKRSRMKPIVVPARAYPALIHFCRRVDDADRVVLRASE